MQLASILYILSISKVHSNLTPHNLLYKTLSWILMGGRSPDSWVVDTWPCLFLVSAASHLLSRTCSFVKWAVIDVNVTYLLDVTSMSRSHVTISICTIQNPPCSTSMLPEQWAYKPLTGQWACSPSIELTKPSLLNELGPRASSLGLNPQLFTIKSNLIKIRSLIRSHISSDLKEQIKGSNFN